MNETNYPGIDYSPPGSDVNRDSETKIRYGIIPQRLCMPEAADDITTKGDDLGFLAAEEEIKTKLRHALSDYFSDEKRGVKGDGMNNGTSRLDVAVDDAFSAVEGWADNVETCGPWQLEEDGVVVRLAEGGDIWVFKSPFYTYAQFCSPCAPGACHLGHPLNVKVQAGIASIQGWNGTSHETFVNSNKCYCLPADWLEDGKAPYRMWRVDNNEEVLP